MFSPLGNVPWFFSGHMVVTILCQNPDPDEWSQIQYMSSCLLLLTSMKIAFKRAMKHDVHRFSIYIFPHMFPFSKHETWIFHVFLSMFSSQTQKSLHLALATSRALRGSYCWMRLASGGCFQKWISYRMPPVDRVQLPQTSGWILYILWFMECLW